MRRRQRRREREAPNLDEWIPRTRLGKMVKEGEVTSIDEVFVSGLRLSDYEKVDTLLPNLQEEVIDINLVQKQTDAGEKSRFKAIVAVGNRDGYIGLGSGKARMVRAAIEKASTNARLNVVPVKRGCGSFFYRRKIGICKYRAG